MTVLGAFLGISAGSSEESVLRLLIELGAQVVGAAEGSLLVVDAKSSELVFAMTVGSAAAEQKLVGQRVPLGEGLVGLAAQTQEVQIGAPKLDLPGAARAKGVGRGQPTAVLAAPMLIGDRLVGVITAVSFEQDKRFGSTDAMLYGRLAAVAGVVVDQQRRLAAVAAIERGDKPPAVPGDSELAEQQILATVQRLVRLGPQAKTRVAALLAAVESLVG
jgi:GAF domain-containing protein